MAGDFNSFNNQNFVNGGNLNGLQVNSGNFNLQSNDFSVEEPNNWTGGEIILKFFIGILIGGFLAVLMFFALTFFGSIFKSSEETGFLVSGIIVFLAFLLSFLGNLIYLSVMKLFFSKVYLSGGKIFSVFLIGNLLLFLFFLPLFFVATGNLVNLLIILNFFVLFSLFFSNLVLNIVDNVKYSISSTLGNLASLILSSLIYFIIVKTSSSTDLNQQLIFLFLAPSLLSFGIIPWISAIWDKIYYMFYSWGKNIFFVEEKKIEKTSQQESEEVNVEI